MLSLTLAPSTARADQDPPWVLWLAALSAAQQAIAHFGAAIQANQCSHDVPLDPAVTEPDYNPELKLPARDDCWDEVALHQFVTRANFKGKEMPKIIGRKEWGALAPRVPITKNYAATLGQKDSLARARLALDKLPPLTKPEQKPTGIVIHHSAGNENTLIQGIQKMHIGDQGWPDIGYHYVVGKDPETDEWVIYEGRSKRVVKRGNEKFEELALGTHAASHNTGNIGICIVGDYDPKSYAHPAGYNANDSEGLKRPPPEAVALVTQLVDKLHEDYKDEEGVSSITQIYGHGAGEHAVVKNHTSCPGKGCLALIEALRMRLGMDYALGPAAEKGERKPECPAIGENGVEVTAQPATGAEDEAVSEGGSP